MEPLPTRADNVVEALLAYYHLVDLVVISPAELQAWFQYLPVAEYVALQYIAPRQQLRLPAFRQFLLEHRGVSLTQHMRKWLSPADFSAWVEDAVQGLPLA